MKLDAPRLDEERSLHLQADVEEVELGVAFSLTVTRCSSRGHEPEPWKDELLAPLVVRLERSAQQQRDGQLEETRHFRAWAFEPGELKLHDLTLRVRSALLKDEAGAASAIELPGEPLAPPSESGLGTAAVVSIVVWLVVVFAALLLMVVHRRRLRARAGVGARAADVPPEVAALGRLQRLRDSLPEQQPPFAAHYSEAAELLREYLSARLATEWAASAGASTKASAEASMATSVGESLATTLPLAFVAQTTEELIAAPFLVHSLPAASSAWIAELLLRCDRVKFARQQPTERDCRQLLDEIESLVRELAELGVHSERVAA